MDFYYPPSIVWCGYSSDYLKYCPHRRKNECTQCRERAEERGIPICNASGELNGCPLFHEYYGISQEQTSWNIEPPIGEGYQLWEFTSEGSPQSPVFSSLSELCEWCEENVTVYAMKKATKEEWLRILKESNILVETDGVTLMLPMSDERLYNTDPENNLNLFSVLKSAQCRYAGLLKDKLPEMVSVREMNMLAFVIQQFDEAEEMAFMQRTSAVIHTLPGELLNLALGICPEAAGFEKGSKVTPVYSGENLHEIMGFKNFLDMIDTYPYMQLLRFYCPIGLSDFSGATSSASCDEEGLEHCRKKLLHILADSLRFQDIVIEEVVYRMALKERDLLLFECPDMVIQAGKLYAVISIGVSHPPSREEFQELSLFIKETFHSYQAKIADNLSDSTVTWHMKEISRNPELVDIKAQTPFEIYRLLSPFHDEWVLNKNGFVPDFRTNTEFSKISSCWIAVSYNRRTQRIPLPTDEEKVAAALFQIGVPSTEKVKLTLFIPELSAFNGRGLTIMDIKKLNLMADLLQKSPLSKRMSLEHYFLSNKIPVEVGVETAIRLLQDDDNGLEQNP